MDESSNGKLWEIQKMETQDGDNEVSGEFKTEAEAEAESVRMIVVNGNPDPLSENRDGDDSYEAEPSENSAQKVDSGEVKNSIVEPEASSSSEELTEGVVQVLVERVEAPDDVTELEYMVIEDNISQFLDETNRDSKVIEEVNDGSSPVETQVVSKAIEEIPLASSGEKGIEQITSPSLDENCEVTLATADVVSKAIQDTHLPAAEQNLEESSGTVDLESKEKVNDSLQEAANAVSVDNKPEIPANTENQPVTSLSQRAIQPTSWRSCCGLLEILHRSDR